MSVRSALVCLALLSCGPKPRVAFNDKVVPSGSGWQCFPVNDPGGPARDACYRTEAECYVEKEKSGTAADRCAPAAQAYCLHIADDDRVHCYSNQAGCDEFRRNYQEAYSISECTAVP